MNVSIAWGGCYLEHKEYFDAMATSMQETGHKVGILTGERESKKSQIVGSLGFTPDFVILWGEFEVIVGGAQWKAQKMHDHTIGMHFDPDATEMKRWTDLWVVKTMDRNQQKKF